MYILIALRYPLAIFHILFKSSIYRYIGMFCMKKQASGDVVITNLTEVKNLE